MGLPSFSISHRLPGVLRLTLSGNFYNGSFDRYASGGTSSTDANLVLAAYAGTSADLAASGASLRTPPIDRSVFTASRDYAYPGGNVVWQLGVAELTHTNPSSGGAYSYGIRAVNLTAELKFR